jgi:translation elongation factor EF-1alpha
MYITLITLITLLTHLLYMHYRESWFLAFIMDTSEEERAKGKTVEVGRAHFETDVNR